MSKLNYKLISAYQAVKSGLDWKMPVSAEQIEIILKACNIIDPQKKIISLTYPINFLMAISSMFGLNEGSDQARYEKVISNILPVIINSPSQKLLNKIRGLLPIYNSTFTASGEHRFYPLLLAMLNILNKENIFSLKNLPEELKDYMYNCHPLYSNPFAVAEHSLLDFPKLNLTIADKKNYTWLDIGSAPKAQGSPTLNLIKSFIPNIDCCGSDILFPYFQFNNNKIRETPFVKIFKNQYGYFKKNLDFAGITYLNSSYPEYNILNQQAFKGKNFDFISLCMVFHHLRKVQEKPKEQLISKKILIGENGRELNEQQKTYFICDSQQKVFDKILEHLTIEGIFFFNLTAYMLDDSSPDNGDAFFIIQKKSADTFLVYDQHPILFNPDLKKYDLSWDLVSGQEKIDAVYSRKHPGLKNVLNLNDRQAEELKKIFNRADILITRYQYWRESSWYAVRRARLFIRNGEKNLVKIFEDYLRCVPEKEKLKHSILKDLQEFTNNLKCRTNINQRQ